MKINIITILNSYNIDLNDIIMFFHYHPSYYQLHLHVCLLDNEALETKYHRNYHLDDVIAKLETDSDYWKKATLKFELMSLMYSIRHLSKSL